MTSLLVRSSLLLGCIAIPVFAQPRVDALQNNYSYLLADDPDYGIARGSIFIIYGARLSNTTTGLQSSTEPPFLQTTLNGVSAQVTVEGVTTDVIWYYLTPTQLGGILPSATPPGDGTIVVNNNGQASAPAPIKVVDSAFGVLTLNGTGAGAAAVYDANYQFLGPAHSARPGDGIQFFGTGLGPTTGSETMQAPPVDLTQIPITATVGGTPATVLFRGRIFPGLDQVNLLVPNLAAAVKTQRNAFTEYGCNIPVVITIGGYGSNVTTIPVSADGGDCPPLPDDPGGNGSTNDLTISPEELEGWLADGVVGYGVVALTRERIFNIVDNPVTGIPTKTETRQDRLTAEFNGVTGSDLPAILDPTLVGYDPVAPGPCVVSTDAQANPLPQVDPTLDLMFKSLDAGSHIDVRGPNGARMAPRTTQGLPTTSYIYIYLGVIGAGVDGDFLDEGVYRLEGPGGADVAAFAGSLPITPDLVWTNREDFEVVDRTEPITITWSGGDPTTVVQVSGFSTVIGPTATTAAAFVCRVRNSAGEVTVPASILQKLPASARSTQGGVSVVKRGSLGITSMGTGVRMFADGVDYLTGNNWWGISTQVEYK